MLLAWQAGDGPWRASYLGDRQNVSKLSDVTTLGAIPYGRHGEEYGEQAGDRARGERAGAGRADEAPSQPTGERRATGREGGAMANMLDYLDWRGDLTLAQDPFNEVDSLVLCQLSYCDLKGIVPAPGERGSVSVATAARRFDEAHAQEATAPDAIGGFSPLTPEPLRHMAASRRFRHATLSRYDELLDDEMGEQFAAICVRLDDKSTYVAFRGTDDTFTGWREDFSMSFTVVGSQERALTYLEAVRRSVRGPLRVGGHSKGGNLAVFAAARSGWATRRRIVDVWCHDGPGFVDGTLDARALEAIEPRIRRFVPEFCVVGQMLGLRGKPAVVASATSAIMQHSALNWQVMGNRFVRRPAIDEGALRFGKVFNEAVSSHDPAWRQRFTDAFFAALSAGGSSTTEVFAGAPGSYMRIARAYSDMEPDIREAANQVLGSLFGESFAKALAASGGPVGSALAGLLGPRGASEDGRPEP